MTIKSILSTESNRGYL